jgi:DNA-directed RNA polymerase specialized sigma24 family protein
MIKANIYDFDKYRTYLMACLLNSKYEFNLCEDAIQEAYIEFHKYVKNTTNEFLSVQALKAFLVKITKHRAFRLKHRVASIARIKGIELPFSDFITEENEDEEGESNSIFYQIPSLDTPETRLFAKDLSEYIDNHKNKNESKILKLYIHGYNTFEIVEITGSKEKTIREWLRRLRMSIRVDFEEDRKGVVINKIIQKREQLTGSKNRFSKINEEQVLELRKLREQGYTIPELVAKYGITKGHVHKIIRKDLWKHI